MAGKAYTMKEMKAIVEYLTEHRAYNEIKGRKMWMDLASSNVTTRTWQSLKETFLKRILPDIHNPYYKLSVTQIASFRQEQDIEKRLKNRLQIRSTSPDTDRNGVKEQVTEKPGNSNEIEDKIAGEEHKLSNLRASTETLVLENCYETAEEIRKDLQSPTNEAEEEKEKQPTKTMRELITYSEPLTPMLQSVIDDFVTDDEEGEPKMQIVEPEEVTDRKNENIEDNVTIEISDSEGNDVREEPKQTKPTDDDRPLLPDKNEDAVTSNGQELEITNQNSTLLSQTNNTTNEKNSSEVKNAEGDKIKSSSEITQNNSVSITDTFLPGNQEAFEQNLKKLPEKRSSLRLNKKTNVENSRKRASSQDAEPKTKKRILSKLKSISDSEKSVPTNGNIFIKSKISTVNQTLAKCNKTSSNVNKENFEKSPRQKEAAENSQDTIMKNTTEMENPCLKNVSLYAEQFSTEKYIDSDTSNMEDDNVDKNKKNEDIKDKKAKKNDKKEKSDNEKSVDRKDKTGVTNKKRPTENEKSSDKVEETPDKNKKSDIKNKSVERINENIEDKNAGFKNKKKINISLKSNEKIENIDNKNMKKIDNNDKTDDKNKKYDKPSSTAGQACVRDDENDVIMLRSYSDSMAESDNEVKRGKDRSERQQRDNALAHMFGFASGAASRRQTRGTDRRKRTISHSHKRHSKYDNMSSASSDWTSDTGSEFVSSPPRRSARKGRHTRKYLKPRSAPILSLEEEGGLFVMYNNKIYPLVKDGKNIKNYVNYFPEDDVDPDESYWKLKYVEESKKTAELTKLLNLNRGKDNEQQGESSRVPPLLPTTVQNNNTLALREDTPLPESTKSVPAQILPVKAPQPNPISEEKKTVKIKFIKNNEEVQLEGHWPQISPVLAHVAQLFQKEPDPVIPTSASVKTDSLAPEEIVESGISTPIEDVVEKVNQREKEIAQEIERYHEQEANASKTIPQTQNNVTKRKGRPRKTSPAVPPAPAKIAKLDVEVSEQKESAEKTQQAAEGQDNTAVTTRRTRTPRKLLAETVEVNQNTIVKTRKTASRKSQEKIIGDTKQADHPDQDDEIRYKFPSPPPPANRKSYTNRSKTNAAAKNTSQRKTKRTTDLFSAENVFLDSIDSMQGYQDSDISPSRLCINKRRRKTSLSFRTYRKRYTTRNRQRTRYPEMTSDSSNSYQSPRLKAMTFQNSTITSEIYRSESYRLLMNKDPKRVKNVSKLGKIVETSPVSKDFDVNMQANNEIAAEGNIDLNNKENVSELLQTNMDENSSNVSLPTSPVLSVVENISISKSHMDLFSSMELDDNLFEDKQEEQITLNELMTLNEDVTMPLMEHECGIEKSHQDGKAYHYKMSISKTDAAISDSLLNKINTVNIQDPSLTETLNVNLKNLQLESAKKVHKVKDTIDNGKKDEDVKGKPPGPKKARKRSSTPRKRQSTRKQKLTNTEPCIVEEHIESCSRFGRQSCPPTIIISEHDCNETITPTETERAQLTVQPTRGQKKKDIIKVKITKPKSKSQDNFNKQKTNFSDSGINETETEIILQASDDSVELIHNHSDTCLNAHECMGDSIQILDNPDQSIISLDSNTAKSDIIVSQHTVGDMFDKQEIFSSDAQDGTDVVKEFDFVEPRQVNSSATSIGTSSSRNSVITEDLSVEIPEQPARNSNWYLFSEDESSNTNCPNYKNLEAIGLGARLEQIFPITCAIPDLSTITEISRENGDSKQFSDTNTRTRDVSNSPNIFD